MQSTKLSNAQKLKLLTPLLLVVTLTACATRSPPQAAVCPTLPTPPALGTPLPSVDYSLNAAQRIKSWRDSVTGTRVMSD